MKASWQERLDDAITRVRAEYMRVEQILIAAFSLIVRVT